MLFRLTPEQDAFRAQVRDFIDGNLPAETRARVLNGYTLTREDYANWHRILYSKGWGTPTWPVEYGGPGWDALQRHIFDQECTLAGAPELVPFGYKMVAPVLMKYGTAAQQAYFLPRIANLEHWWSQGYSEPGAGSDLASLRMQAVRLGNEYVVNGQKTWNTHGQYADWIFCLVRTSNEGKPQEGISFLLIDLRSPGVEIRPIITLDGAHEINEVWFTDVVVPIANRVGDENKGWTYAKYLLSHERANFGSFTAQCRRDMARIRRIAALEIDGPASVAESPLFRARLARLEAELMAIETTNLLEIANGDVTDINSPTASFLKIMSSELQQEVAELALLAGGPGALAFDRHSLAQSKGAAEDRGSWCATLAPTYLNMRKTAIYGGSNEVQKNIAAKLLLG